MENQKKNPRDDDGSMKVVVPPDDQRCRRNSGKGWRCRNIVSGSHNPSEYCDKHYKSPWYRKGYPNQAANKNQNTRKLDSSDDETQLKRKRVETTEKSTYQLRRCGSKELRSMGEEEIQKFEVQLEGILGVCKTKCLELLGELEEKTMKCIGMQGKIADQFESMKIGFVDELKKFNDRGELKKMGNDMEHEKCTAQGEGEFWRNKFCDLEARVLRLESCIGEPRGLQNDAPLHNGEREGDKEMSENDAEFSGGRQCSRESTELQTKDKLLSERKFDKNTHCQLENQLVECPATNISSESPNYVSCGGQKVEDVNGRVETTSGYESTSETESHLELSEKLYGNVGNTAADVNLVELVSLDSDGENVGQSPLEDSDSKISLGDCIDKLATKCRNGNNEKGMKWEIEDDMISSFEEDPELCMKAVCALYRQQSFEENYANGLFRDLDASWIKNLAEFLMEGDGKADLKKSMKEFVEVFTYKELEHCKRLASSYSKQLFNIYKDKEDPFFLPTSTASV